MNKEIFFIHSANISAWEEHDRMKIQSKQDLNIAEGYKKIYGLLF